MNINKQDVSRNFNVMDVALCFTLDTFVATVKEIPQSELQTKALRRNARGETPLHIAAIKVCTTTYIYITIMIGSVKSFLIAIPPHNLNFYEYIVDS